jgi:uncharacterized protein with PQ loop repeat
MDTTLIGYLATSTSVIGFTIQFVHTLRTKKTEGISLPRTFLDFLSLALWVLYATRVEDTPLLIATSFELFLSFSIFVALLHLQKRKGIVFVFKVVSPASTPSEASSESSPVSTSEV